MIGTGGLVLVVSHLLAVPVLVLGVGKKYITKLECEKYFLQGHILNTTGNALGWYFTTYPGYFRLQTHEVLY
jgi:hypothetical protein